MEWRLAGIVGRRGSGSCLNSIVSFCKMERVIEIRCTIMSMWTLKWLRCYIYVCFTIIKKKYNTTSKKVKASSQGGLPLVVEGLLVHSGVGLLHSGPARRFSFFSLSNSRPRLCSDWTMMVCKGHVSAPESS